MPPKEKCCRNPQCDNIFRQFNSLQQYCSAACQIAHKGKPKGVRKISAKRQVDMKEYSLLREEFLSKPENQQCFIDGCYNPAESVEHRAGRWGKNYLDTTTWAPCCLKHNLELERNPELSKQYQLSKIHGGKKL